MVRRQGARAPRASWSAVPQVTGGLDAHELFAERLEVLLDSIVIDLHGQERSRATQLPELPVQLRQRDTRADDTEHAEATRFAPATPAHGSRAAPRAGTSAAASRRGAPPARDGAADQPAGRPRPDVAERAQRNEHDAGSHFRQRLGGEAATAEGARTIALREYVGLADERAERLDVLRLAKV